jgi:glycosyltransferase involved in cell wall biosynthesis
MKQSRKRTPGLTRKTRVALRQMEASLMKILIVTENFTMGGLETHLLSQIKTLGDAGHEFFVACSNYKDYGIIDSRMISATLSQGKRSTNGDIITESKKIADLARWFDADIIHAHPFNTIIPSVFAGYLTRKPVFVTLHGTPSIHMFGYGVRNPLYEKLLNSGTQKVYVVSEKLADDLLYVDKNKKGVLNNGIDLNMFFPAKRADNGHWALISRLEREKVTSIKHFMDMMKHIDIKHVDIYGAGSALGEITQYAQRLGLDDKVTFRGVTNDVPGAINGRYEGIIGMNRVILEAMAMNLPALLIHPDHVAGILYDSSAKLAMYDNMSGEKLPPVSPEQLNAQLPELENQPEKYSLRGFVQQYYDANTSWNNYIEEVSAIKKSYDDRSAPYGDIVSRAFELLNKLDDRGYFYESPDLIHLTSD